MYLLATSPSGGARPLDGLLGEVARRYISLRRVAGSKPHEYLQKAE
jgi:hypothetical protein